MTDKQEEKAEASQKKQQAYDVSLYGERRKAERRRGERRGVLRWDPRGKDRRSGTDRRAPPPPSD